MAVVLKADTQVVVQFGPFVDKGDGVTLESAISAATLDNVTTGIRISKNGGTFAARAATVVASAYDAHGMYKITLKTGDVDTEGVLRMVYDDAATCLPVWQDYQIVNANVYDSLFAAATTDYLQVDTLQLGGATQSATDLKDFADAGYDPATNKVQGVVLVDTTTVATDAEADIAALVTTVGVAGAGLTNLGGSSNNWNVGKTGYTVSTVSDKTGYSLAADQSAVTIGTVTTNTDMRGTDSAALASSLPTNFSDMSISVTTGLVDITQTAADKAWDTASRILTASTNFNDIAATDIVSAGAITTLAGAVVNVDLVDTITTYTGNTLQTGDVTTAINDLANATDGLSALKTLIDALQVDLDTLTDATGEPTGIPGVSETLVEKVGFLYSALRNQVQVTATKKTFFDDSGVAQWEKDLSDNGTTYQETEGNAI